LSKFVVLKGLPDDLRKTLKKDLEEFVAEIKKSLKDNVSKISRGREKMLILLNTFGLNDFSQEIITDNKNNKPNTNEIIPPTGRKIIF
jgi:beta-phosphoglucomutase-like phosphatase (HAD superfamily)